MAEESRKSSSTVKEARRKLKLELGVLKCKLGLVVLEKETPYQEKLAEFSLQSSDEDEASMVGVAIGVAGNAGSEGNYDQTVIEGPEKVDTVALLDELDMEPQGFPRDDERDGEDCGGGGDIDSTDTSQESVYFQGVTFHRRRCYRRDDGKIYAIKYFVSKEEACIVRVYPFHETFVGGLASESRSPPKGMKYVQIPQKSRIMHLKHLVSLDDAEEIPFPDWACSPRKGRSLAYWNTAEKIRCGKREKILAIDLYANVGGFSAGMSKAGIHTTIGVEKERMPISAFALNHNPGIREADLDDFIRDCRDSVYFLACQLRIEGGTGVFNGTVKKFLEKYKENRAFRFALGSIDYVHLSPPCQGFSPENRNGGTRQINCRLLYCKENQSYYFFVLSCIITRTQSRSK